MHQLLEKYLKAKGINSELDLTDEERISFDRWQAVLIGKEIKIEDIIQFCNTQIDLLESQFGNIENSSQKIDRLTFLHSIYRRLLGLLTSPQKEREQLEANLTSMLLSK